MKIGLLGIFFVFIELSVGLSQLITNEKSQCTNLSVLAEYNIFTEFYLNIIYH